MLLALGRMAVDVCASTFPAASRSVRANTDVSVIVVLVIVILSSPRPMNVRLWLTQRDRVEPQNSTAEVGVEAICISRPPAAQFTCSADSSCWSSEGKASFPAESYHRHES